MKKTIFTTISLVAIIALMSFTKQTTTPTIFNADIPSGNNEGYHCVYAINHRAQQLFISNVFYCEEVQSRSDINDYIENELDYKVESVYDCAYLYHEEKNYVYDDRNDKISWAKNNGYRVIKFNVSCSNEKLYKKD